MSTRRALACLVVLLACSHVFGQDYEIRLSRPVEVGQEYEITASGYVSEEVTVSGQGQVLNKNTSLLTAKLEGTITVVEIDDLKRGRKLTLAVSKFLMSTGADAVQKEALPKGTQVVAQVRGPKGEFFIDGNVVPPNIAKMLTTFLSLPVTGATDNDIFGTKERQKVGDSWPVNGAIAAKDLAVLGVKVDPKDIKGSTTLDKVAVVDGTNCLHLSTKMEMSKLVPPLPPGVAIEKSSISGTFSGEFPVDISDLSMSEKGKITMEVVAKGKFNPNAPEITVSTKRTESKRVKTKYLK